MNILIWTSVAASVSSAALLCLPQREHRYRIFSHLRVRLTETGARFRSRRASTPAQLRQDAAALLRQFSALLQSGRGEGQAWGDLLAHWRAHDPQHPLALLCASVVAAESAGAPAADGLRRAAAQTPSKELRQTVNRLIAVTALSEQTGAALSHLMEQLASAVDESAQLAGAVQTAVAGPKLTQLILTLLPAGGVLLGHLMGAAPTAVLFGGGLGVLCLLAGLGFLMVGRMWSARMISAVMRHV